MAESKGSAPGSLYTRLGELQAMTPTDAIIAQYCEDSFPHVALTVAACLVRNSSSAARTRVDGTSLPGASRSARMR